MNIGIIGKSQNQETMNIVNEIKKILIQNQINFKLYPPLPLEDNLIQKPKNKERVIEDIIICIGGDGTILRTLHSIQNRDIPIFGIGIGRKNFLASADENNYIDALNAVINGDYKIDERMCIQISKNNEVFSPILNEIYVTSKLPGKMIDIQLSVNRGNQLTRLLSFRGDGIIVSTQTGSSAYSLAAGGALIDPHLSVLAVTPVCASIYNPPLILNSQEEIVINLGDKEEGLMICDGHLLNEIKQYEKVNVIKSSETAKFINFAKDPKLAYIIKGLQVML